MAKKLKMHTATELSAPPAEINIDLSALETVVATIEATEEQVAETSATAVSAASATDDADFKDLLGAVSDSDADEMLRHIDDEVSERSRFENETDPDNANIHRTLKKVRGSLVRAYAAKVMIAAGQDPAFINRSIMDGSRYNVYALGKYGDLVDALAGSGMTNAINIHVVRSMFNLVKAGIKFTGELAKAAASDKYRISPEIAKHMVRHTVSTSTAPTQVSSTMAALETLGIVKVEGSRKHPTYVVLDTPQRRRLEAVCEAMAA